MLDHVWVIACCNCATCVEKCVPYKFLLEEVVHENDLTQNERRQMVPWDQKSGELTKGLKTNFLKPVILFSLKLAGSALLQEQHGSSRIGIDDM